MNLKRQVDYYLKSVGATESRKCSNCFEKKPVTEFYRKLDSYQSRCKACNAEVVRGYNQRLKRKRIAERWKYMLHADAAFERSSRNEKQNQQNRNARFEVV